MIARLIVSIALVGAWALSHGAGAAEPAPPRAVDGAVTVAGYSAAVGAPQYNVERGG